MKRDGAGGYGEDSPVETGLTCARKTAKKRQQMPRKRSAEAEAEAQKAQEARWRHLVRNPDFLRGLENLDHLRRKRPSRTARELARRQAEWRRVADKWGLESIPPGVVSWVRWHRSASELERYGIDPLASYLPVEPLWLEDDRFFLLRLDLQHPVDTLLPLIEKELRKALKEFSDRGLLERRRRRLDKLDFQLRVFDLAKSGQTFKAIARKLGRLPSTVKSAYLIARQNIFGQTAGPSKKVLPLVGFDPARHVANCRACQRAQTDKEICPEALLYANQDQRGRRERPGYETTRR